MAFRYREGVDVLAMLKAAGYSTYRVRREKILGESVLQKIRNGVLPSWHELDVICSLIGCKPDAIIEYIPGVASVED